MVWNYIKVKFLYKIHISYLWILSVVIKKDEWLLRFSFSNYFYQLKYYKLFLLFWEINPQTFNFVTI